MAAFYLDVSEHAVIRWLERVYKIDIEAIREEIRAAATPAASLGASKVSTQGVTICIGVSRETGEKLVTTILPCGSPGVVQDSQARGKGYQGANGKHSPNSRAETGKWERRAARGLKA